LFCQETNKVEGILIDLPKPDLIHLSPKAFKKMKMLKIFINRNAHFFEEPSFLSNELRLLDWHKYPGKSLPSNFCGKNLVVLRMRDSHLKEFEGVQVELLFLVFLPLANYVVNFFQTNLFPLFIDRISKT
jgi:hypothetical protein